MTEKTILRFSDGVAVDTSGPLRLMRLHDGYYVIGQGSMIPCSSREDALATLRLLEKEPTP